MDKQAVGVHRLDAGRAPRHPAGRRHPHHGYPGPVPQRLLRLNDRNTREILCLVARYLELQQFGDRCGVADAGRFGLDQGDVVVVRLQRAAASTRDD